MVRVTLRKDETFESLLKRFKRQVRNAGIIQTVRSKEYYVRPGIKKRLKHEAALKARRKKK